MKIMQRASTRFSNAWEEWLPSESEPWNQQRAIHLHRRAGFGGTWNEIQRDLKDGHHAAIKRFLDGNACESGVPENFDSLADLIGISAVGSNNPNRLQAWWFYRMIYSPDPLSERLCLMWHNHFATSNAKVESLQAMHRQNLLFRKYGRGRFGDLLKQVMRDPAVLVYLDANLNQASHPNENLGREMLELFSVGIESYTEADVANAARCLTGLTVKDGSFEFLNELHDPGEKTLLGQTGDFDAEDAVRIAAQHPATAKRIVRRVCEMLMGENVVVPDNLNTLADQFLQNDSHIGWLVETVLRSKLFFSSGNVGNRVIGPTEFIVGCIRSVGAFAPPPSTLILVDWASRMGQRLFYPPNVFGFPQGRNWITTNWLIARQRFAEAMLDGKLHRQAFDISTSFKVFADESIDVKAERSLTEFLLNKKIPNSATEALDLHELLLKTLTTPSVNLG